MIDQAPNKIKTKDGEFIWANGGKNVRCCAETAKSQIRRARIQVEHYQIKGRSSLADSVLEKCACVRKFCMIFYKTILSKFKCSCDYGYRFIWLEREIKQHVGYRCRIGRLLADTLISKK